MHPVTFDDRWADFIANSSRPETYTPSHKLIAFVAYSWAQRDIIDLLQRVNHAELTRATQESQATRPPSAPPPRSPSPAPDSNPEASRLALDSHQNPTSGLEPARSPADVFGRIPGTQTQPTSRPEDGPND